MAFKPEFPPLPFGKQRIYIKPIPFGWLYPYAPRATRAARGAPSLPLLSTQGPGTAPFSLVFSDTLSSLEKGAAGRAQAASQILSRIDWRMHQRSGGYGTPQPYPCGSELVAYSPSEAPPRMVAALMRPAPSNRLPAPRLGPLTSEIWLCQEERVLHPVGPPGEASAFATWAEICVNHG